MTQSKMQFSTLISFLGKIEIWLEKGNTPKINPFLPHFFQFCIKILQKYENMKKADFNKHLECFYNGMDVSNTWF